MLQIDTVMEEGQALQRELKEKMTARARREQQDRGRAARGRNTARSHR